MKPFMDEQFMLKTPTSQILYHQYAAKMPIWDYHCHISPADIALDTQYENLTQLWLSADHYKWRMMRSDGIDEHFITGPAADEEKFLAFARMLPKAIGNPMYHWCHLELQRYFGYEGVLNEETAETVWALTEEKLRTGSLSVRQLLRQSRVDMIGTTDDPADDLKWHRMLSQEPDFQTKVVPSFRPDKALNIEKPEFLVYLQRLGASCNRNITCVEELLLVLEQRLAYFVSLGCNASDHGLDEISYIPTDAAAANTIMAQALQGNSPTAENSMRFKSFVLLQLGKLYKQNNIVMQLHYGAMRNINQKMMEVLGPDSGYDAIANTASSHGLARFLNALEEEDGLPKTILYSLNPCDNEVLVSIMGAFQQAGVPGKIQHGSAWWFCDTREGMRRQLISLAELGILGNFIGMLTDSRSFLSYPRHEYFRRVLCDLLGDWVEQGLYPADMDYLGKLVENVCYHNARLYFGQEEP